MNIDQAIALMRGLLETAVFVAGPLLGAALVGGPLDPLASHRRHPKPRMSRHAFLKIMLEGNCTPPASCELQATQIPPPPKV